MNRKVLQTIKKYSMVEQGDTVIAAVSGGADSVALLHLLCALDLGVEIRACHLNHCLRGAESDRDEQLVRTMCREYGVPLDVRRADVRSLARQERQSLELAAREERYRFFFQLSETYQAKIATAHTLSDLTETVLFHMARGTGLDGLCGIPPVRGTVIRPMLACSRSEIEQYCAGHDLAYVNDSTNALDDYSRNFIRHHVVPPFTDVNDGALKAVERMTRLLRDDAGFLRISAQRRGSACRVGAGYDARVLRREHPAMRSRIIKGYLEEHGVEISSKRVALAEQVLFEEKGAVSVGRDARLVIRDGVFVLEQRKRAEEKSFRETAVSKKNLDGMRIRLPEGRLVCFSVFPAEDYEIFKNNGDLDLKSALDYDKIDDDLVVRPRKNGDRMRPAGRGCSKTVKKLYNELAVPERESRCILADRNGILFAECVGADERAARSNLTKNILMVRITEEADYDAGYF